MKAIKLLIRIIGIGFLLGGLWYFSNLFSIGGVTQKIAVLLLRLVNAVVWIGTGYGLLRLKKWSLYGLGLMIALYVLTTLYNLYFTFHKEELSLIVPAIQAVVLLFLVTYKNKLLEK